MRKRLAAALFVAAMMATNSGFAGSTVTFRISGPPDAVVHYSCDFVGGGTDSGDIRPQFATSWNVNGLTCLVRQIDGHRGVIVELRGNASRSRVSTSGQGSTVRLSWGDQP